MRDTVLPFLRSVQPNDYSCGVHAVKSVFNYYGMEETPDVLEYYLGTDVEDGTNERQMARTIRFYGLGCRPLQFWGRASLDKLRDAIDDGQPVIVALDSDDHWGVVHGYGYSKDDEYIYLMDPDPEIEDERFSAEEFLERWDGWGMRVYAR